MKTSIAAFALSFAFGAQPPEVLAKLKATLEAMPDVAGLTCDYSDILGLERSNP